VPIKAHDGSATKTTSYGFTAETPTVLADDAPTELWILDGYSPPASALASGWPPDAAIRTGRPLTWSELSTVVDETGGTRVGPGLIQTLISTARDVSVPFARAVAPTAFQQLGIPEPLRKAVRFHALRHGWGPWVARLTAWCFGREAHQALLPPGDKP
jgi:hypothetical protein